MSRVYGGLKWWQWLIVAGWVGATVNMYGLSLRPSDLGIVVGTFLAAYLIIYGLRWVWGFGSRSEQESDDLVAPGGGVAFEEPPDPPG